MSRSRRFLGGLGFGYIYQALALLGSLWLTPFLIRNIGKYDFGLWGLGTQLIYYLGLMDLGIVALLPREVAYATGRAIGAGTPPDLRRITSECARVVLLQTPVVALAAVALWFSTPPAWVNLRQPLAVIMGVFVLMFPARILTATLDGLQDLSYLGAVQIATWISNFAIMVFLVSRGAGLWSLAAGWIALQAIPAICALVRLKRKFPNALPGIPPAMSARDVWNYLRKTIWISVAQFAQTLLSNTDFMILGYIQGPEVAVIYSCTGKLVSALSNQPQLLMTVAIPAISELKATGDRSRLLTVSICLMRLMMTASGLIACLVLTVNQRFVAWWVSTVQFGGLTLTSLIVVSMLLRHLSVTATAALLSFGKEKRISITTLGDGLVNLVVCTVSIHFFGLAGAAIGPLMGIVLVSLPFNFLGLAIELGSSPWTIVKPLLPWFWRFLLATAFGQLIRVSGVMKELPGFFGACAVVALVYIALMAPLLLRDPLGEYTRPLLARLRAKVPSLAS